MLEQIQSIVQGVLEAKKLTDSALGIVESIQPIKVKIDNRFILDESFFTFLTHIEIKYLEVGDKLSLLRVQNGQHFIVQDVTKPRDMVYYSSGVVLANGDIFADEKHIIEQSLIEILPYIGYLETGDKLSLLRVQDGQRFIVINKV